MVAKMRAQPKVARESQRRFFLQSWRTDTWDRHRADGYRLLDHTADDGLRRRGVAAGDVIYVCANYHGSLRLAGRLIVARVVGQAAAEKALRQDLWEASDHALAALGAAEPIDYDRTVPPAITQRLRFLTRRGPSRLKFRKDGRLDYQTLRPIRELTPDSAAVLDRLIGTTTAGPDSLTRRPAGKSIRPFSMDYVPADEAATVTQGKPFDVDPDAVDRSSKAHRRLQNLLAENARQRGARVFRPSPGEPPFDTAWTLKGKTTIAEVKSSTPTNQVKQLRLGLGQLLDYRAAYQSVGRSVEAVLFIEQEPIDPRWLALCQDLKVKLSWGGAEDRAF